MNAVLQGWNGLDTTQAALAILPCCGSSAWARELAARRPLTDPDVLCSASDSVWWSLPAVAWQQAFDSHPRIGQTYAQKAAAGESLRWSANEQKTATISDEATKRALAEANTRYEAIFGRIFIVCATGRTAKEILGMLEARIGNDPATELRESAEQQRRITQLRLRSWLKGV